MAIYYIAPATHPTKPGSDSNDGSVNLPKASLSAALALLSSGDTLRFYNGDWLGSTSVFAGVPDGSGAGSETTLISYESQYGARLYRTSADSHNAQRILNFGAASSYIKLDGFKLDGGGKSNDAIHLGDESHHMIVQNCWTINTANHGLQMGAGNRMMLSILGMNPTT